VGLLFALAFGAKEIGVVLPALLFLVEAAEARSVRGLAVRLRDETPRIALLAGVGAAVLAARTDVLGALAGEDVTSVLWGLGPIERLRYVLPVWLEYLRLMVWPVALSADYDPGVIYPAAGPSPLQVMGGGVVLVGLAAVVALGWRRSRGAAVAAAWFGVAYWMKSAISAPASASRM